MSLKDEEEKLFEGTISGLQRVIKVEPFNQFILIYNYVRDIRNSCMWDEKIRSVLSFKDRDLVQRIKENIPSCLENDFDTLEFNCGFYGFERGGNSYPKEPFILKLESDLFEGKEYKGKGLGIFDKFETSNIAENLNLSIYDLTYKNKKIANFYLDKECYNFIPQEIILEEGLNNENIH